MRDVGKAGTPFTMSRPYEATFDNGPIGAAIVAMDGSLLRVNRALCRLVGLPRDELEGLRYQDLTQPGELADNVALAAKLVGGELDDYEIDRHYVRPDGAVVWVRLAVSLVRDDCGHPVHFVAHIQDVTRARAEQARLQQLALHDALTGLPNRVLLLDRVGVAVAASERRSTRAGILYCDLDGFKKVNDEHGHGAGDVVLLDIARRLLRSVRPSDTVARVGGDEFVVLCPDLRDEEELAKIARRLRDAVDGAGLEGAPVGLSVGATLAVPGEPSSVALMRADAAMYEAKRAAAIR
jgi:diguanylate cyclase (GGDEF)-like protein/PAS domain S-box-containing protein